MTYMLKSVLRATPNVVHRAGKEDRVLLKHKSVITQSCKTSSLNITHEINKILSISVLENMWNILSSAK